MTVRGFSECPAEEVLRRRIREEREGRGWTQQHLADLMTAAGAQMTHDTVSKIESGERRIYYDEAVFFSGVLEVPLVRLGAPLEGEEVVVRVDPWRKLLPVEFRNWFVFGHSRTLAARDAQVMFRLGYAALDLLDSNGQQQLETRKVRLAGLRSEVGKIRQLRASVRGDR